ncbi:MAG TPA: response regulator [Chloroflexota bacterium]|nr:response regulator [Chloroflexota bacterium]
MARPTILAIDDNAITRKLTRVALNVEGYDVVEAEDGRSGLEALEQRRPDLVLQDMVLPDIGGIELVRAIRARPAGANIPVIAMSGFLSEMELAQRLKAGFTDFLFKPVEPSHLVMTVRSYIHARPPVTTPPTTTRRVLVVDDDPVQLKLATLRLKHEGYDVSAAADGQEALALIRQSPPDLVLADVLMPGMDGFRLCREIKHDPSIADTAVLLNSSAFTDEADRELGLAVGAEDLLLRTPDWAEILAAVQRVLGGSRRAPSAEPGDLPDTPYLERIVRQLERLAEQNMSHVRRIARLQTELGILTGISDLTMQRMPAADVLGDLLGRCLDGTGLSTGWICLLDESGEPELVAQLGQDVPADDPKAWQALIRHAARVNGPSILGPSTARGGSALPLATGASAIVVPLQVEHVVVGAMLLSAGTGRLTDAWLPFAAAIGNHMSAAVALARGREQLHRSELRYRSLADAIPVGVFELADDLSCVYVNRTFEEMSGLLGPGWRSLIQPDDMPGIVQFLRTARDDDHPYEFPIKGPDGEIRWVQARAHRHMTTEEAAIVGTVADITDQKRAEIALRDSEEVHRAVVENLAEGVSVNVGGIRTFVNRAYLEIHGLQDEAEALNRPFDDRVVEEDRERIRGLLDAQLRGERVATTQQFRVRRADGQVRTVEGSRTSITLQGTPAMVTVLRDLTDQHVAEMALRQAQKMEAIGLLAGGIAHDFNNLLTAILGFTDLMLAHLPDDSPARLFADEVLSAGERASNLTRQLLTFSRQQVLQPEVLDLNGIVTEMDKLLRRVIGENIDLATILQRDLSPVKVDRGQMDQVIMNLAVNARDAMPGGGKLTIETAAVDLDETYLRSHGRGQLGVQPGRYVMLAVSDSGVGMDAETQARIFDPFFTTKDAGKGTGLGLSTVYGIVQQSGGSITVYSEPGVGTTFKIYLPVVDEAPVGMASRIGPLARGSETLLLVEDEPGVRALLKSVVRTSGYQVLEAQTGEEALTLAGAHAGRIDLLMTDLVLPGMTGRELSDQLAAARPGLKVLFLSGYTSDVAVRQGVLNAKMPFLQKPFTAALLSRKVREVLDSGA